ncbi:MAG: DUF433 domain-containing protein [Nostoc sp.]|uniref:DUF433 domain-containing protein n=1 Tax=Nostoc sp. TaxID=1180 RepID=UPI002FF08C75
MDWQQYIHSDPKILLGKLTVKGTRLSVEFLLGLFAAGWTEQQVVENYPTPLLSLSGRAIARSLMRQSIQAILLEKNWSCICY